MTEFTTLLQQGNAWFFIPSAILLGALHGLEPGHSKTMMAAFIIAIKGTIKQAVMLGLAATISHTAVVWLIAFGGMVISKRFTAQSAEPWLQLISAVIIISTAFWMFWRTWRGERNWLENMHEHEHEHEHDKADGAHDEHHHDDAGHADMGAMYTYTCATPAKLTGLEATLFSLYPSLEKLSVQGILPTGQTAAELTPSANKLGW